MPDTSPSSIPLLQQPRVTRAVVLGAALIALGLLVKNILIADYAGAMVTAIVGCFVLENLRAATAGRAPRVPYGVTLCIIALGLIYAVAAISPLSVLWLFPTTAISYLLLPRRQARVFATAVLTLATIALLTPQTWPVALRFLASSALTVVFLDLLIGGVRVKSLQLEEQSNRDPLTGCLNRRGLAALDARRAGRGEAGVMLLVDLDHFKQVNDRLGHQAGDDALKLVAQVIRAELRPDDVLIRLGGDEFLLVLIGVEPHEGLRIAERVRAAVDHHPAEVLEPVTLSIGLSVLRSGHGIEATLAQADTALYAAKREGRNRVTALSG